MAQHVSAHDPGAGRTPYTEASAAKLLYTIDDAADLLSLSRTVVYELIVRGELRALKLGRCRRIAAADLAAFVERLRAGEPADAEPPPTAKRTGDSAAGAQREVRGADARLLRR